MRILLILFILVLSWTSKAQSSSSTGNSRDTATSKRPISDDSTYMPFYEHFEVTDPATFPNGDTGLMKFFVQNWKLAEDNTDKASCRRVYLSFIVDIDGNITEVKLLRKTDGQETHEEEAKRILLSTSGLWKPATLNGKKVNMIHRVGILCNPERRNELKTKLGM